MIGPSALRAGRAALTVFLLAPSAFAAEPIFPAPLHLTRQISDPISGKTVVVQEYAYGNRLVSVRGARTSIADYEKSELIEIDRDRGTYSVTRFDAIARATQVANRSAAVAAAKSSRPLRAAGTKVTTAGRSAELFEGELESPAGRHHVTVAVDRSVLLSRTALEILTGAAYPATRSGEHDVVLAAAAPGRLAGAPDAVRSTPGGRTHALPVEQVVRHEMEGQTLEFRTTVTRIGSELPPADLVSIPAGAQLVESRIVAVSREVERLDSPSFAPPDPSP